MAEKYRTCPVPYYLEETLRAVRMLPSEELLSSSISGSHEKSVSVC